MAVAAVRQLSPSGMIGISEVDLLGRRVQRPTSLTADTRRHARGLMAQPAVPTLERVTFVGTVREVDRAGDRRGAGGRGEGRTEGRAMTLPGRGLRSEAAASDGARHIFWPTDIRMVAALMRSRASSSLSGARRHDRGEATPKTRSVTNDYFAERNALEVMGKGSLRVLERKPPVNYRMQRMSIDDTDEGLEVRARADAG